ncbi:MAG: hypothetical protein ACLTJ5_10115 [Clostridium sp.]
MRFKIEKKVNYWRKALITTNLMCVSYCKNNLNNTKMQVTEGHVLEGISENKNTLETARDYKDKNLNMAALDFYQDALEKADTVEVRREMIQAYRGALKDGEIDEQTIVDDFVLASVDQK